MPAIDLNTEFPVSRVLFTVFTRGLSKRTGDGYNRAKSSLGCHQGFISVWIK